MAIVPAICESCGVVWGAENLIGGDATGIQFVNSRVGPCPNCGGMGLIPDGVYDIRDDTLQVVASANVPPETLRGLVGALESLRRGEASPEEVIEKAEAEAPELAPIIRRVLELDPKFWASILIAILLWYLPSPTSQGPTADEIATELRADNTPGLVAPPPSGQAKSSAKRKRPTKAHGKAKQRKSRKRRK
jgi:hypothetical protein